MGVAGIARLGRLGAPFCGKKNKMTAPAEQLTEYLADAHAIERPDRANYIVLGDPAA